MVVLQTLWQWVRFPLTLIALLVLGLGTWVTWALTDQRYQRFLTQQLSDRLAAEVQIGTSHVTVRRGVGIALDKVTIRDRSDSAPFFTADAIDVFLDVSSLLRGHFDFRQITIIKPTLHVIGGMTKTRSSKDSAGRPRSKSQRRKSLKGGRTQFTRCPTFHIQSATVAYTEKEVITAQLETDIGQGSEIGTLTLHPRSQEGGARIPFSQRHCQGEVTLSETHISHLSPRYCRSARAVSVQGRVRAKLRGMRFLIISRTIASRSSSRHNVCHRQYSETPGFLLTAESLDLNAYD